MKPKNKSTREPRQQSPMDMLCARCGKAGQCNRGVEGRLIKCPDCGAIHRTTWADGGPVMMIDETATDADLKRQGPMPDRPKEYTTSEFIDLKIQPRIPTELLAKLKGGRGKYTDYVTIFYALQLSDGAWIGVIGDGDNGRYERFRFNLGKLAVTELGYGNTELPLRDELAAACLPRLE